MNMQSENHESYSLFAQNIVATIGKEVFKKDKALSCLAKSNSFFKNLTVLFNKLNYCKITPLTFFGVISALPDSVDKKRLELCAEIYENYINVMAKNSYSIPFAPKELTKTNLNSAKNEEIKERIKLLQTVFDDKKNLNYKSEHSENIEYKEFSDIQSEGEYLINSIKKLVEEQKASYCDIAVFVDKTEARQKFSDLMKTENIPVQSSIYNENYENLKHKINVYEKICEICTQLKLEEFNYESFKNLDLTANLNYISKSQKEICLEQLDEVMKSLAEEVFSDSYTVDKILNLQEKNRKSLTESMFSAFNIIDEAEKETLSIEFGAIKNFYAHYKEYQYAKAIETVIMRFLKLFDEAEDIKQLVLEKIGSLNKLQELYDTILQSKPDFESFKEILQLPSKGIKKEENAVRLTSITANFKENEEYKYVFVAGLTENNFPATNKSYPFISQETNELLSKELQKHCHYLKTFLQTDENHFMQRFYAMCEVMCHAKEKIVFTTRNYEAKKSVQPSVFFKVLKTKDYENFKNCEDAVLKTDENADKKDLGCVRIYEEKTKNSVVEENDILKLNASAISTFQSCPRKYYFKNLLNLKETSTFSASYGSIVHAVFEIMNKNHLENYNKETALALGEILFNAKNDVQRVLDFGFSQIDVDLVCATDDLALKEMKENFKNALDDFELSGYFEEKIKKAVCEKEFSFSLNELSNVVFDGRIDAILTNENNETAIVDYKTGKDKINSLGYAISEFGVNFKSKTGKDPANVETLQDAYDYQIPLYYLACQNSHSLAEFKDKISRLGLLYVRPKNKHNGCNDDFVDAEKVELYKEKIIQNLKETVVDKIRNEKEFKPKTGFGCEYCSYKFLCDEGSEDE